MRVPRHLFILAATTIAGVLSACGVNDRFDAPRDRVVVRTYADVDGNVPPFAGTLGTTFCTSRAGWNCLIHPEAGEHPYDMTSDRVTRVVVHELGHTLAECGRVTGREHAWPVGCYLRDSDATLEGVPPLCAAEASMAREWWRTHGTMRVVAGDAWLDGHVARAVRVWNEGAGVDVFRLEAR